MGLAYPSAGAGRIALYFRMGADDAVPGADDDVVFVVARRSLLRGEVADGAGPPPPGDGAG